VKDEAGDASAEKSLLDTVRPPAQSFTAIGIAMLPVKWWPVIVAGPVKRRCLVGIAVVAVACARADGNPNAHERWHVECVVANGQVRQRSRCVGDADSR